jgi:hypothetical protein
VSVREEIVQYCRLKKFSQEYTTYWLSHPVDEAWSGDMAGPPHHIRTRGAGGQDRASNLLALSPAKHRLIHNIGAEEFAAMHPWLAKKIRAALAARRKAWDTPSWSS